MDIRGHVVTKALDRARLRHRARVLPLAHLRPRREEAALHVHDRRAASTSRRSPREPGCARRLHVDPLEGFQPYQARRLVYEAGIADPGEQKQIMQIIEKLYEAFVGATRCSARSTR